MSQFVYLLLDNQKELVYTINMDTIKFTLEPNWELTDFLNTEYDPTLPVGWDCTLHTSPSIFAKGVTANEALQNALQKYAYVNC